MDNVSTDKIQGMIVKLTQEIAVNPNVLALVLAGKSIDMEMYILVKDKEIQNFKKELPKIAKKSGLPVVFEDSFRLELLVVNFEEIKSVFSTSKIQPVKVLLDKTKGKLQKVLE